jgi:hypothetical protein
MAEYSHGAAKPPVLRRILNMTTDKNFPPAVLDEKEAAYYIGMSCGFLRRCRMNGVSKSGTKGPAYVRVPGGRTIRYLLQDLDAWLLANRFGV